jgi:hypothetical protein
MRIDPKKLAVDYYFGDLQYWKLPRLAADALEEGYDGPALRKLAWLANLSSHDIRAENIGASEIDAAFREMGVNAPVAKDAARLALAIESANRVLNGQSNVFDEATHVRIHLCELSEPPESLRRIVSLSKEAKNAPRSEWSRIEADLNHAFSDFLTGQRTQAPE